MKKGVLWVLIIFVLVLLSTQNCSAKLNKEKADILQNVKVVMVKINESYQGDIKGVSLPFYEITQDIFGYVNIEIVENDAQIYDAILNITSVGRARGASYTSGFIHTFYAYPGASLTGTISLEVSEATIFEIDFDGDTGCPDRIFEGMYKTQSSAPFFKAFRIKESFVYKMIEIIYETYGCDTLLRILKSDNSIIRENVIFTLGEYKDPKAILPLINALKDEDNDVWQSAQKALQDIGTPAIDALIASLKDENLNVRRRAPYILGSIKNTRAILPLINALKDEDNDVWQSAQKALQDIGTPAIDALIASLKDENLNIRGGAAYILGSIGNQRGADPLINVLLNDQDPEVRKRALNALIALKDSRVIDILIKNLNDQDPEVRADAVKALGKNKDPKAILPLINALKDEEWLVRDRAVNALKNITGQDLGEDAVLWQEWWEKSKN